MLFYSYVTVLVQTRQGVAHVLDVLFCYLFVIVQSQEQGPAVGVEGAAADFSVDVAESQFHFDVLGLRLFGLGVEFLVVLVVTE